MKRPHYEPEYRRRIRQETAKNQEATKEKDRESGEERHVEQLAAAIHGVREELTRNSNEYRTHKNGEHWWHLAHQ